MVSRCKRRRISGARRRGRARIPPTSPATGSAPRLRSTPSPAAKSSSAPLPDADRRRHRQCGHGPAGLHAIEDIYAADALTEFPGLTRMLDVQRVLALVAALGASTD